MICDHKQYLAFLDGGLYDNLGLASVENIRNYLSKASASHSSWKLPVHYVIATDVGQIPAQFSSYIDPEEELRLRRDSSRSNAEAVSGWAQLVAWPARVLQGHPLILVFILPLISACFTASLLGLIAKLLSSDPVHPWNNSVMGWIPQPLLLAFVSAVLAIVLWCAVVLCGLWLWLGVLLQRQNKNLATCSA